MDLKPGILCSLLAVAVGLNLGVNGAVKFTNVICGTMDKNFSDFEYCYLKAVNRSYQYLSLKVKLYKLEVPLTNVSIKLVLSKRANGYQPFLYNVTFDACRFVRYQNSNKVVKFFYDIIKPYTNMNHTCPYDHDLIIDRVPTMDINNQFTNILPFPLGEYRMQTYWYMYGIHRFNWTVFISLT